MPGDCVRVRSADPWGVPGPFEDRKAVFEPHDVLPPYLEHVGDRRGDLGADRETVLDDQPLLPCGYSGQAVRGPELVIQWKQTHLTWPVLKDLEGRDRSDRRPPAGLPRQVQNVDEAFRLPAEIHEQADHSGFRYAATRPVTSSPTGNSARPTSSSSGSATCVHPQRTPATLGPPEA